jgi:hypothetical protein
LAHKDGNHPQGIVIAEADDECYAYGYGHAEQKWGGQKQPPI